MTLDELEAELEVLKETRETSERELAALAGRRGELQAMERDMGSSSSPMQPSPPGL